jgi:Ca2+-binding EF-hand superfamily protein/DNA-directed RNA polymerase subunit F
MRDFHAADESEREAKRRITRLKREIQRAKLRQADAEARQRRQEEVRAFRARLSEIRGTNIAEAHADIEPATEGDVTSLSELFNASLLLSTERGASGEAAVRLTWYETFKLIDTNRSGLISFDEFRDACRHRKMLAIAPDRISDTQLIALWKALDLNGNGTISAGEWGHFMMRGAPAAAESARQRLFRLRLAHQRKFKADADARSGRDLAVLFADITPASESELNLYATQFHSALRRMTGPREVDNVWFRLFRTVDLNDSGLIDFQEFETVARELLRVVHSEVTDEQLQQLWKALDEDGSGKIDAGEVSARLPLSPLP